MEYLICPVHRIQYPKGTTCSACPPKRRTGPARAAQREFRTALLAGSDGRCGHVDAAGIRCDVTENLQAAHIGTGYADGGGFNRGSMLCPRHHAAVDRPATASAATGSPGRA